MNANFGIECALPPSCEQLLEAAAGSAEPIFLSLNDPATSTVAVGSPILWDVVVEDKSGMYDSATGEITIPRSGLWQINCRITISQTSMAGFPATFYQHILQIVKKLPFPDGFNVRFIDFFQEDLSLLVPPGTVAKQVELQGNETIRLEVGDSFNIQPFSVIFTPAVGAVSTVISGAVCLNCCTVTRLGD